MWKVKSREGCTYERIDAPAELEEMAFRAVRLMGLTLSSVDALPVDGGYVILEVNSVPGSISMVGKAACQETMNGVYDWAERHAAAAEADIG
jgi:ribosomal protein S6--L-glutamate ligase